MNSVVVYIINIRMPHLLINSGPSNWKYLVGKNCTGQRPSQPISSGHDADDCTGSNGGVHTLRHATGFMYFASSRSSECCFEQTYQCDVDMWKFTRTIHGTSPNKHPSKGKNELVYLLKWFCETVIPFVHYFYIPIDMIFFTISLSSQNRYIKQILNALLYG